MKYIIFMFTLFNIAMAASFAPEASYQVCFTPKPGCRADIISQIRKAKRSIKVQAYTLTSWQLGKALVKAKKRGVDVEMIVDKSNLESPHANIELIDFLKKNIPMWVDSKVSIAHNKVMIFDGSSVETGSYNFTNAAEYYNAENVLIIHDAGLAQLYVQNWRDRQAKSYRLNSL